MDRLLLGGRSNLTRLYRRKYETFEFARSGLRYMITEFASLIQGKKSTSKILAPTDIVEINRIPSEYDEF